MSGQTIKHNIMDQTWLFELVDWDKNDEDSGRIIVKLRGGEEYCENVYFEVEEYGTFDLSPVALIPKGELISILPEVFYIAESIYLGLCERRDRESGIVQNDDAWLDEQMNDLKEIVEREGEEH